MSKNIIDFSRIDAPIFAGKVLGEKVRSVFNLDNTDNDKECYIIKFSNNFEGFTSTFFHACFSDSILFFNDFDKFFNHYKFLIDNDDIRKNIVSLYHISLKTLNEKKN